ncbi:30S ribosomal protein S3, partial [Candidatus Woesearchaeota archaeon]|nr:30S ribosomal protein S3 [Candidatus Woesearchaeota archaeon]
ERFGIQKFKAIGHKTMQDVMAAGALGIEIKMSGKIPSARAKTWRFYTGYLKKCGNAALTGVKRAKSVAQLKPGVVGVKVAIMPPDITLPDDIEVVEEQPQQKVQEKTVQEKNHEVVQKP